MKPSLEVRHFAALIAVAEHGTVGKASRALGVAQSTLSETLLSLERALGADVLERAQGRTAQLTTVAQRLLPHARHILLAVERAQAEAWSAPQTLNLGTTESLSASLMPGVLEAFHRAYPALDVQVSVDLCEALHRRLAQGELQLVVTMELASSSVASPDASMATLRELAQVPLWLLGGAETSSAPWREASMTIHLPDPGGALHQAVQAWAAACGVAVRLVSLGSVDAVRRRLRRGDALAVLPALAVSEAVDAGGVTVLQPPQPLPWLSVRLGRAAVGMEQPLEALSGEIERQLATLSGVAGAASQRRA